MAFCGTCGTKMEDGVKFCPSCGAPNTAQTASPVGTGAPIGQQPPAYSEKLQELNNTLDSTAEFDAQDIQSGRAMAILSYIGILVLIPLLAGKGSRFARYHTNQGLVLFLAEIAYSIVYGIVSGILHLIRLGFVADIVGIVGIVFFVLAVIGIINAANGRAKELPVIGQIKLLK